MYRNHKTPPLGRRVTAGGAKAAIACRRITFGGTFRGRLSLGPRSSIASTEDNDGRLALLDADGAFHAAITLEGPGFESEAPSSSGLVDCAGQDAPRFVALLEGHHADDRIELCPV